MADQPPKIDHSPASVDVRGAPPNLLLFAHDRADARVEARMARTSTRRDAAGSRTPTAWSPTRSAIPAPASVSERHLQRLVVIDADELAAIVEAAVRSVVDRSADDDHSNWLDAREAAELLRLHRDTVGRMARRGTLPAARIGREYRFRRSELLAWIDARSRGAR